MSSRNLQPTLEEVISRKPDIIIETVPAREGGGRERRRIGRPWACQRRVYIEADEYLMVPGPRSLWPPGASEIIRGCR